LFKALRETREKLSDRSTFAAAAAALQPPEPAAPPASAPPAKVSLDDLVEETGTRQAERPARALDQFQTLVRDLVAPHLVPRADPRQAEYIAQVDAATSEAMRGLLQRPEFQELEAAWRGLFFLVRRLETDVELKLYLLDVSKTNWRPAWGRRRTCARRASTACWSSTRWRRPAGSPGRWWERITPSTTASRTSCCWEAWAASPRPRALRFWPRPTRACWARSLSRKRRCGELAPHREPARASLGDPAQLPGGALSGTGAARFLLRLPYGKETEAAEQFAFEEFEGAPVHEHYLWGNPALACVCLLAQAFAEYGWEMRPGAIREIDGLPAHLYREDGEPQLKPCAEALLTEGAANAMLDRGLMPLVSLKDRDAVRLVRFQSLADPPAPLAGRWAGRALPTA